MDSFKSFFECGTVYKNRTTLNYSVVKFSDLDQIIIPFFIEHQRIGIKHLDFMDWIQVAEGVHQRRHLTQKGWIEIKRIKGKMKRSRINYRSYTCVYLVWWIWSTCVH